MKKLNTVAMLFASAALAAPMSSAFAQQPGTIDNWRNVDGHVWMNGTDEYCWRNNFWTPATAAANCDGALKPVAPPPPAPPAPPPPPPAPPAPPAPVSEKVTYQADAFFDFDKSILKQEAKVKLDDLIAKTQGLNVEVMIAVGHTDSIGTEKYNQALSIRRAEAVKAYVVSKGVDTSRVYTEGKGELQPVADNKTRAGRAQNRRTVIEVVGIKK